MAQASVFPKIVQTETQRFFGIVGKGPFDTCGPLFQKLSTICQQSGLDKMQGAKLAMLVLCNVPETEKADLEWACAISVPQDSTDISVPHELEEIVVPGKKCATTIHRGSYHGLPKAWGDLCMKWVPSQKLRPAKGSRENVHFEVYVKGCGDGTKEEDLETQLFCPIEQVEE